MDDCIVPPHRRGRGYSSIKGEFAHRYTMRQHHVPIEGMVVRHLCGNKRCCNVNHLTVGTQLDNMRDPDAVEGRKQRDLRRFNEAKDKPCPKCGGPRRVYVHGERTRIRCNKLGCW